jgi:hypothetical protein
VVGEGSWRGECQRKKKWEKQQAKQNKTKQKRKEKKIAKGKRGGVKDVVCSMLGVVLCFKGEVRLLCMYVV